MPEVAGIVLLVLVANFVTPLSTVLLRLLPVLLAHRLILRQVLSACAGAASVYHACAASA